MRVFSAVLFIYLLFFLRVWDLGDVTVLQLCFLI
jgi:hypothetical protein